MSPPEQRYAVSERAGAPSAGLASPVRSAHPLLLAVSGMCALASAVGIGRFVYTPIVPAMVDQLHLSKAQAGAIASANFLGYLLGALVAATPRLPGSQLRWVVFSSIVVSASMLAMPLAPGMPAFFLLRFVAGAASAFVLIFTSGMVVGGLQSMRASPLVSVHFAGVGVGIAFSALLIATMRAAELGWHSQWLAAGLLAAVTLLPTALCLRDHERHTGAPVATAESMPGFTSFTVSYGLFGFGYSVTATFLVVMVRAASGSGDLETAAWLCVGLTAIPPVWLWGKVRGWIGVRRAMAVASILLAFGNAGGVLKPDPTGLIISAVALGATFMGITALGFVATQHLSPERRRSAAALITAAFGLGQIVGPLLAGALADTTGSFVASTLIAAGALLLAALLLVLRDPDIGRAGVPRT